jgi:type VI protein secretion system component Hcp
MKKKPGKTRGSARRSTAKDLAVKKGGGVKGGAGRSAEQVNHSEFKIVKLLDAATPKLFTN